MISKRDITRHQPSRAGFIGFVDELPKTATGKIQRFRLREREAAGG